MEGRQGCRTGQAFLHAVVQTVDLVIGIVDGVAQVFNVLGIFINLVVQGGNVFPGGVVLPDVVAVFLDAHFVVDSVAGYYTFIAFRYVAFDNGDYIILRDIDGLVVPFVNRSLQNVFVDVSPLFTYRVLESYS